VKFTIEEHQHRLACWAAGRGAFRAKSKKTVGFSRSLLEECGLSAQFVIANVADGYQQFDDQHRSFRTKMIEHDLSDGEAAKILNLYFKVRFVCGPDHSNPRVQFIHPPVDSLLLLELARQDVGGLSKFWRTAHAWRWTKFTSEQYEQVIKNMRKALNGKPLWTIEQYWPVSKNSARKQNSPL
jgi:hypothetical protein